MNDHTCKRSLFIISLIAIIRDNPSQFNFTYKMLGKKGFGISTSETQWRFLFKAIRTSKCHPAAETDPSKWSHSSI